MSVRNFACILIGLIAALLSSCIEGREEIWLHVDGSGKADLRYDIPASAARFHQGAEGVEKLIGTLLKDFPNSRHEVVTDGDRLKIRVLLDFKSASDLDSLATSAETKKTPASFDHLAGKFVVERSLNKIDFTRTISPGKAFPTAFIPASQFQNRKLTYILHLPLVPTESNADKTADGGRTLIWDQPLSQAIREPIVIHFKATIPIPAWMILTAIGVAVILIAIVWKLLAYFARGNSMMKQAPPTGRLE